MTLALIDGDLLLFQSCCACETDVAFPDDFNVLLARREEVRNLVSKRVTHIAETLDADPIVIFGDSVMNWRKQLDPTYKANRKTKRKPLAFREVKEWMLATFKIKGPIDTLEGDDVMGVMATMYAEDAIVVTNDKDLKQIPGKHANMDCTGIEIISQHEADYWHMRQTLTGDAVDGYPGCPGVGPVTAEKILGDLTKVIENNQCRSDTRVPITMWQAVVKAYQKAKLSEDDALLQARLARIVRHGEYDIKTKKVKLWMPPSAS